MVLAPFFVVCFHYYGYQGTILLLAGFGLQYCVAGALMRDPIPGWDVKKDYSGNNINRLLSIEDDIVLAGSVEDIYVPEMMLRRKSKSLTHFELGAETESIGSNFQNGWHSDGNIGITMMTSTIKPKGYSNTPTSEWIGKESGDKMCSDLRVLDTHTTTPSETDNDTVVPSGENVAATKIVPKRYTDQILQCVDYRLLKQPRYVAFCIFMCSASICYSVVNNHLAGQAKEKRLNESTIAALLVAMGIVGTFSKLLSGFLFDWRRVKKHRSHLLCGLSVIMALCILISPWCETIYSFYIIWLLFMSTGAIVATQESIILSDTVSRSSFANAFGMSRVFRGLGVLVGPTFGGKSRFMYLSDYICIHLTYLSLVSHIYVSESGQHWLR